jgi:hypothetical protein
MKNFAIAAAVAAGLAIGSIAGVNAALPKPPAKSDAEKAAEAEKAAAAKAKEAEQNAKAQDKAVANYKKTKGKHSSSAGATAPAPSQGADHSSAGLPDSELTPREAQTQMPKPGQVNDYSTPKRDPQNSSRSR